MNGETEIYVSGRPHKVPEPLVTYKQIVKITKGQSFSCGNAQYFF